MSTPKTKLVKVNSDRTVSFLSPGRPPAGTEIFQISGKPLTALLSGGTVRVTRSGGFRIVSASSSSSATL